MTVRVCAELRKTGSSIPGTEIKPIPSTGSRSGEFSVYKELIGKDPKAATSFFLTSLKACAEKKDLRQGSSLHAAVCASGLFQNDPYLGSTFISMYAKCGALARAQRVHNELPCRDVVTWSALIGGYVHQGKGKVALECYDQMRSEGFSPNAITYALVLKACGIIRDINKGGRVHNEIVGLGLLGTHVVLDTALVDMYAKCGSLLKAQRVFDELTVQDIVSWSVLIAGYVQHGQGMEALECYERMQSEGLAPNAVIYTVALKACSITKEISKGKRIHDEIISQQLLGNDIVLGTALIDMYAKCGLLLKAQGVLKELRVRNIASWNALIGGYAHLGKVGDTLCCFQCMQWEGISPNGVTFLCLFHACRHSGLVDDGQMLYECMKRIYNIVPNLKHQVCMLDLFGHAGHFDRAMAVIKEMPSSDHLPIWSSLLGASQKWGNVRVGRLAFEHIIWLDESNAAAYMCMERIYAAAGMHEDAIKVQVMRARSTLSCPKLWKKWAQMS